MSNTDESYFSIIIGEGTDAVDIGKMVDGITNIDRDIGNTWINTYGVGTGRYGSSHEKSQLDKKNISITFIKILPQNEMALWRNDMFSAVDCPNGPRKLVFNDEPNKYYNVLIDSAIDFKYDVGSRTGSGTIQFVVPDGIAHSSIIKQLTNDTNDDSVGSITFNSDGSVTAVINNTGNVDAYPIISIENNTENDYLGLYSKFGVVEIGNKYDPSGQSITDNTSVTILNINSEDNSDTTGWGLFKNTPNMRDPFIRDFEQINGNLKYGYSGQSVFGKGLTINTLGSTRIGNNWFGGFKKFDFPIDPLTNKQIAPSNFDLKGVCKFWESRFGQPGIITISLVDDKGIGIMNYTIYKTDLHGENTTASFLRNTKYPNIDSGDPTWIYKRFGANNNERNQPNPNVAFNSSKGQFGMSKNGPYLFWTYNGIKDTLYAPELATTNISGIVVGIGTLTTDGGKIVETIVLNSLTFVANNVSATVNAPNLFTIGSKNKIDMSSGNIEYIEDITVTKTHLQNEDLVDGSECFGVPKGINTIEIIPSIWAKTEWLNKKPNISISWVENFG